jgi:endonuclease/exonuclease/phosphatase (EEP) superfamily protein YafD
MSWNTYKIDHKTPQIFKNYIRDIHDTYAIDVFCLQEAVHNDQTTFPIDNFETVFASNIERKKQNYGVATVSSHTITRKTKILTTHRESVINTHKASLITDIVINGIKIVIVNIHAINFKSSRVYEYEFEKIKSIIQPKINSHPIIIAGDFNSWNKKRVKIIKDFCLEFGFKTAFLDEEHLVKSFQKYSLDFILYRGLYLENATALDCVKISDHNPIVANFEVLTN